MKLSSRLQLVLSKETHEKLKQHKSKTGVPVGEFVRRAIEEKLKKENQKEKMWKNGT